MEQKKEEEEGKEKKAKKCEPLLMCEKESFELLKLKSGSYYSLSC